jgi:hypothetical protein
MTELVYGQLRYHEEYSLLEKEAGEKQIQAFDCSTWGEYARLTGLGWDTFYEEWYQDLDGLRDGGAEGMTPDTPMEIDWASLRSSGESIAGNILDPREVAYRALPSDVDYSKDPLLDADLDRGGASPGGNIGTVSASKPATFERLGEFLAKEGYEDFSVRESEDFVLACYEGFH